MVISISVVANVLQLANFQPNSHEAPITPLIVLQMPSVFKLSMIKQCVVVHLAVSLYLDYQPPLVHDHKLKLVGRWEVKSLMVCGGTQGWGRWWRDTSYDMEVMIRDDIILQPS